MQAQPRRSQPPRPQTGAAFAFGQFHLPQPCDQLVNGISRHRVILTEDRRRLAASGNGQWTYVEKGQRRAGTPGPDRDLGPLYGNSRSFDHPSDMITYRSFSLGTDAPGGIELVRQPQCSKRK